ncbi:protein SENESCENCE-ASSOCIATED GENE 21, mitochondrial-like [Cucurbita moschata]|uniref:Protein SENESCENCE-ASSOCIATED GENE 21, mitochondrial-like n=1 Tax=Cucurbita moschata TaxID=3662 RepID=A0A6J1GAX2_CUCMO|nr:protein SENESCENCE-ASSOCIATED GENE 21, mitochondrial-like [Cucurbita moschata]
MARSLSRVMNISSLVSLIRRGYRAGATAASQRVASGTAAEGVTARSGGMIKKEEEERRTEMAAWIPDPVTGYYRPENYTNVIDEVDLRAMLLKPKRNVMN